MNDLYTTIEENLEEIQRLCRQEFTIREQEEVLHVLVESISKLMILSGEEIDDTIYEDC